MIKKNTIYQLLILFLLGYAQPIHATPLTTYNESVYIYNFVQFMQFVPPLNYQNIVFCTIGESPEDSNFNPDAVKPFIPIRFHITSSVLLNDIPTCDILYINQSALPSLGVILEKAKNRPILTISKIHNFILQGGMVELIPNKEGFIGLGLNLTNISAANLHMDPLLTDVAQIIVNK